MRAQQINTLGFAEIKSYPTALEGIRLPNINYSSSLSHILNSEFQLVFFEVEALIVQLLTEELASSEQELLGTDIASNSIQNSDPITHSASQNFTGFAFI